MIALPIPISEDPTKAPPAPKGVAFIPLREASDRSGIPVATLAGKCRREWAQIGLAMVATPGGGGVKPCWHVREDADSHFARIKSPEALPFDWMKISEAQRGIVRDRRRILVRWSEAKEDGFERGLSEREATAEFLAGMEVCEGRGLSRKTLLRWERDYRSAGYNGLLDGRLDKDGAMEGGEFIEELKRLWLNPRQKGVALCYAMACEKADEKGWPIPFGERQAQRIIAGIDPKIAAYHRRGPREYEGTHGKYILRDYSQVETNQVWVSDGHEFNVFVLWGDRLVRPVLSSWIDMRSRYCVGRTIRAGAENSDSILAAFKQGVKECGLPLGVYHDNGKGYDAKALQGMTKRQRRRGERPVLDVGVFERLEVGVHHARPYNAKAKIIERWHRTIDERFSKRWDTYCGSDTANKPHDLGHNREAGKAPTLEEFASAFDAWLIADYHNREHDGEGMEGMTPAEAYCKHLGQKRPIEAELLELELLPREKLTVGRNGITRMGITYEAPELDVRGGQDVVALVDNDDIGHVKVLDAEGRFLCVATTVRKVPACASGEELREAMAEQRRDKKRVKAALPAQVRMADDPIERMQRRAAEKAQTQPQPRPETIKPVRSKLEREVPAIRRAMESRRARGDDDEKLSLADIYRAADAQQGGGEYASLEELYPEKAVSG